MNLIEFRHEMDAYRKDVAQEGRRLRDSLYALDRLEALYRKFDDDERKMADEVIAEWILSDDPDACFDGESLAWRFKIASAVPALEELSRRFTTSRAVDAPAELEKVNGILEELRRA